MNILDKLDQEVEEIKKESISEEFVERLQKEYDEFKDLLNERTLFIKKVKTTLIDSFPKILNDYDIRNKCNNIIELTGNPYKIFTKYLSEINTAFQKYYSTSEEIDFDNIISKANSYKKSYYISEREGYDKFIKDAVEFTDYVLKISTPECIISEIQKQFGDDLLGSIQEREFEEALRNAKNYLYSWNDKRYAIDKNKLKISHGYYPSIYSYENSKNIFKNELNLYHLFLWYKHPDNYKELFIKSRFYIYTFDCSAAACPYLEKDEIHYSLSYYPHSGEWLEIGNLPRGKPRGF